MVDSTTLPLRAPQLARVTVLVVPIYGPTRPLVLPAVLPGTDLWAALVAAGLAMGTTCYATLGGRPLCQVQWYALRPTTVIRVRGRLRGGMQAAVAAPAGGAPAGSAGTAARSAPAGVHAGGGSSSAEAGAPPLAGPPPAAAVDAGTGPRLPAGPLGDAGHRAVSAQALGSGTSGPTAGRAVLVAGGEAPPPGLPLPIRLADALEAPAVGGSPLPGELPGTAGGMAREGPPPPPAPAAEAPARDAAVEDQAARPVGPQLLSEGPAAGRLPVPPAADPGWTCRVCMDDTPLDRVTLFCGPDGRWLHSFHRACLVQARASAFRDGGATFRCPCCRAPFDDDWASMAAIDDEGQLVGPPPAPPPAACVICARAPDPFVPFMRATYCDHAICEPCRVDIRGSLAEFAPSTCPTCLSALGTWVRRPQLPPHMVAIHSDSDDLPELISDVDEGSERLAPRIPRPDRSAGASSGAAPATPIRPMAGRRDASPGRASMAGSDLSMADSSLTGNGAAGPQGAEGVARPARDPYLDTTDMLPHRVDVGVPEPLVDDQLLPSLPPPGTFPLLQDELGPSVVAYAACPIGPRVEGYFRGARPWIACGREDAPALADALALISGARIEETGPIGDARCPHCRGVLGDWVVGVTGGRVYHAACWETAGPATRARILWHGQWPAHTPVGPLDEVPTLLMLGMSGSSVQAVVQACDRRHLRARLLACSSVPADRLDLGHGHVALASAADAAWGSRLTTRAFSLSWASAAYRMLPTAAARRRLLLAEFVVGRQWRPAQAPLTAVPQPGASAATLFGLFHASAAGHMRDAVARARAETPSWHDLSVQEATFRWDGPPRARAGSGGSPPEFTQFAVRCRGRDGPARLLRLQRDAADRCPADWPALWQRDSDQEDAVLLPLQRRFIPAAVAAVVQGVALGHHPISLLATANGLVLCQVSDVELPGLLQEAGLIGPEGLLASSFRNSLSFPVRLARHGALPAAGLDFLRLTPAHADTDFTVVIDRDDLAQATVLAAVSAAVQHTVTATRVQARRRDEQGYDDAWLVRVPRAAAGAFRRWQLGGFRLASGHLRFQARPAPHTRAQGEGATDAERRRRDNAAAVEAQRLWDLSDDGVARQPFYLEAGPTAAPREVDTVQLALLAGSGLLRGALLSRTMLRGVEAHLALLPAAPVPAPAEAASWLDVCQPSFRQVEGDLEFRALASDSGDATLAGGRVLVLALAAGTDLVVRSATHTHRVFLHSARVAVLSLSSSAASRAAAMGVDDALQVSVSSPWRWALVRYGRFDGRGSRDNPVQVRAPGPVPAPPPRSRGGGVPDPEDPLGGPQWQPTVDLLGWLACGLRGSGPANDSPDSDLDVGLARGILRAYCPMAAEGHVQALAAWLCARALSVTRGSEPRHLMWPWLCFLWALDAAGLGALARDHPLQFQTYIGQITCPGWAREGLPFNRWVGLGLAGAAAMPPAHPYPGSGRQDDEEVAALDHNAPALPDEVLEGFEALLDRARAAHTAPPAPASGAEGAASAGDTGTALGHEGSVDGLTSLASPARRRARSPSAPTPGGGRRRTGASTSAWVATADAGSPPVHLRAGSVLFQDSASPLSQRVAIVDPAGVRHLCRDPTTAGGASGAIYGFLGLTAGHLVPSPVRDGLRQAGDVVFYRYQPCAVIHAIPPHFGEGAWTFDHALEALTRCYSAVLGAFAHSDCDILRLCPLAGGTQAGCMAARLPELTLRALDASARALSAADPEWRRARPLELWLFGDGELDRFQRAAARLLGPPAPARQRAAGPARDRQRSRRPARSTPAARPPLSAPAPPLVAVIGPYGLTPAAAQLLDLNGANPQQVARLGQGAVEVPGPDGPIDQACGASAVHQLLSALSPAVSFDAGWLARKVRALGRLGPQEVLPIADVWWTACAQLFGLQPQPWLLCIHHPGGLVDTANLAVAVGPGPWNGLTLSVYGTGAHFRPLWWGPTGLPTVPLRPAAWPSMTGPLALDAGPSAAVLQALGAAPVLWAPLDSRDWVDEAPLLVAEHWRTQVEGAAGQGGVRIPADWFLHSFLVACRALVEPMGPIVGEAAQLPAQLLVHAAGPAITTRRGPWTWVVVADADRLWLGRLPRGEGLPAFLLAAAGRFAL